MRHVRRYLLIIVIGLFILAGIFFGRHYYHSLHTKVQPAISAISPRTPLFIEIKHAQATLRKLTGQTAFWKDLMNIEPVKKLNRQILRIDSVLTSDYQVNEIYQEQQIYLSFFLSGTGDIKVLYIAEIPLTTSDEVKSFIKRSNGENSIVLQKDYREATVSLVNMPESADLFKYTVYQGLFIGSFDEELVNGAIDQLESGNPLNNEPHFRKVEITAGKNVDANLYINYSPFAGLVSRLVSIDAQTLIGQIADLGEWTEADVNLKSDEILLNGYTITADSVSDILDRFRQDPQLVTIPEILPYHVSTLLEIGLERLSGYYAKMLGYLAVKNTLQDFEARIENLNKQFGVNLQEEFLSLVGNELAVATLSGNGTFRTNSLVVIRTKDVKEAAKFLDRLASRSAENSKKAAFEEKTGDYTIKKLEVPDLIPALFGPMFDMISENYYLTIKEYIVLANNPDVLKTVIKSFYENTTLAEDINFKNFANNLSDRSNILFYCNIRNSPNLLYSLMNDSISKILSAADSAVRNFEGFGVQYSYSNRMFYTNFYLKYNPSYEEPLPSNREIELQSAIIDRPYLVRSPEGKMNVIVFDSLQNMYLIDNNLKIKWKVQLPEAPMSPVYEVENSKDNSVQYLFNTENYLFLLIDKGENVSPFPIKLITRATNAVTVIDYDGKKDYRLILALDDNKIYNYTINGELVEGWEKVQAGAAVTRRVEYLADNGKDYLFITDQKGNVTIVNRRGEDRIKLKKDVHQAENASIYNNETNDKGPFLTTDVAGKLVYITADGKTSSTTFGNFSPNHYFFYADFSGNQSKDFIFIDSTKLIVFDRFKKIVLEKTLPDKVKSKPVFFTNGKGKDYIGIRETKTGNILIVDKNGQAFKNIVLKGTTSFAIGSLDGNDQLNLLIGNRNKLVNYLLE